MTRYRFDLEMLNMQNDLLKMCDLVQDAIRNSIDALVREDVDLAKKVYKNGSEIDEIEHKIERICLNLIARQQPIATDLRKISAALKIITDMERIGDQAEDISMLTVKMSKFNEDMTPPSEITLMAKKVNKMVEGAIEAYIKLDIEKANEICAADDEIDNMFLKLIDEIGDTISKNPKSVYRAVNYVLVVKYLERIADHATNIAEWVVFIVTGEHKEENFMDV